MSEAAQQPVAEARRASHRTAKKEALLSVAEWQPAESVQPKKLSAIPVDAETRLFLRRVEKPLAKKLRAKPADAAAERCSGE